MSWRKDGSVLGSVLGSGLFANLSETPGSKERVFDTDGFFRLKMINDRKPHYRIKPVIDGDFDFYKITFPPTTQKIPTLIRENPDITREEPAKLLGITPGGVKYHLDNLKKKRIIKRIGGRKDGHREVS